MPRDLPLLWRHESHLHNYCQRGESVEAEKEARVDLSWVDYAI